MKGKVIEVKRICGECFKENGEIVPIFNIIDENTIIEHNHKKYENQKKILDKL